MSKGTGMGTELWKGTGMGTVLRGQDQDVEAALHEATHAAPNAPRGSNVGQPVTTNSHWDVCEAFTAWKILIVVFLFAF